MSARATSLLGRLARAVSQLDTHELRNVVARAESRARAMNCPRCSKRLRAPVAFNGERWCSCSCTCCAAAIYDAHRHARSLQDAAPPNPPEGS